MMLVNDGVEHGVFSIAGPVDREMGPLDDGALVPSCHRSGMPHILEVTLQTIMID